MKLKSSRKSAGREAGKGSRILCGTDFTDNAHHAVRVATAVAQRLAEPVVLVHALDFPGYAANRRAAGLLRQLKAGRRKALQKEAAAVRAAGARADVELPLGRPDEALVELAGTGSTRLVVVASQGRRFSKRWFVGSVSERTAGQATVPTLVVREAAPFEAWTRGERPLKVFVAFNFTATSDAALRWVQELQAIGPCEVVVGYVDWPPEQRTRLGGAGPLPLVGNLPDVQVILERDLQARVAALLGDLPFRLRVEANWGRPDARLADMAGEEGADLLVVGSHQYRGFERLWHRSVSRGLLHGATMSVAVVPHSTRQKRGVLAPPTRRVLVSTDFSDLANQAVPHAYALLTGGGTVHLLHVLPPAGVSGGPPQPGSSGQRFAGQHARRTQSCAEKLRALIPPEAALRSVLTEVEVVEHHDAAEGICQAAERSGADVICLSTHGHSGLTKVLHGSVAQKVMTRTRKPLLVIRPQVE